MMAKLVRGSNDETGKFFENAVKSGAEGTRLGKPLYIDSSFSLTLERFL